MSFQEAKHAMYVYMLLEWIKWCEKSVVLIYVCPARLQHMLDFPVGHKLQAGRNPANLESKFLVSRTSDRLLTQPSKSSVSSPMSFNVNPSQWSCSSCCSTQKIVQGRYTYVDIKRFVSYQKQSRIRLRKDLEARHLAQYPIPMQALLQQRSHSGCSPETRSISVAKSMMVMMHVAVWEKLLIASTAATDSFVSSCLTEDFDAPPNCSSNLLYFPMSRVDTPPMVWSLYPTPYHHHHQFLLGASEHRHSGRPSEKSGHGRPECHSHNDNKKKKKALQLLWHLQIM